MPREFRFPSAETRVWMAWQAPPVDNPGGTKTGTIMRAIGRLKPGVTPAQAAAEGTARAIAAPDAGPVAMSLFGAREPIQIFVRDAKEAAAADVRPAIVILLIAAILLFATAIANVANMQLARATARHRELTIRAALGAGTGRLARQLLIENAMAGVIGSALGLLLTVGLHAALAVGAARRLPARGRHHHRWTGADGDAAAIDDHQHRLRHPAVAAHAPA